MSAVTGLALAMDASMQEFSSARVAVVLLVVALLHVVRFGRVVVHREAVIYACFLAYMLIELIWTNDWLMAMNTLLPAANFLLALLIFGSFIAFHELRAILAGSLTGFLLGAAIYTSTSGFPFRYPAEFSYNSIASMYLFSASSWPCSWRRCRAAGRRCSCSQQSSRRTSSRRRRSRPTSESPSAWPAPLRFTSATYRACCGETRW